MYLIDNVRKEVLTNHRRYKMTKLYSEPRLSAAELWFISRDDDELVQFLNTDALKREEIEPPFWDKS